MAALSACAHPSRRMDASAWKCGRRPGRARGNSGAHLRSILAATKAAGAGTGLRFSDAMDFVRQHGGTLKLVSPPEGGSRFVLEFPAAKAGGAAEALRARRTSKGTRALTTAW